MLIPVSAINFGLVPCQAHTCVRVCVRDVHAQVIDSIDSTK